MSPSSPIEQLDTRDTSLSGSTAVTEAEAPLQADSLFTLPPEVRCAVYRALFGITDDRTLRRREEAKFRKAPHALFNNSILRTCKAICTEALPLFYATQKFHYAAERNGLLRHLPLLKSHAGWIKYLSVEISISSKFFTRSDEIVAIQIKTIAKYCTTLSEFTLHIIPAIETNDSPIPSQSLVSDAFAQDAAARALKALRPRLQLLSIVTFGNWDDLYYFRKTIASAGQWVEGDRFDSWPGLSLTKAQDAAVGIKQRRYTLAGTEDVVHPDKICVRIFHIYRPKIERQPRDKRD